MAGGERHLHPSRLHPELSRGRSRRLAVPLPRLAVRFVRSRAEGSGAGEPRAGALRLPVPTPRCASANARTPSTFASCHGRSASRTGSPSHASPSGQHMLIAIASQNFRTITPHAGKTRRFMIFDAQPGQTPHEVDRLDLDKDQSIHEFNEAAPHPLDAVERRDRRQRRPGLRGSDGVARRQGRVDRRKPIRCAPSSSSWRDLCCRRAPTPTRTAATAVATARTDEWIAHLLSWIRPSVPPSSK